GTPTAANGCSDVVTCSSCLPDQRVCSAFTLHSSPRRRSPQSLSSGVHKGWPSTNKGSSKHRKPKTPKGKPAQNPAKTTTTSCTKMQCDSSSTSARRPPPCSSVACASATDAPRT